MRKCERNKLNQNRNKGFTLLEALIAFSVLMIVTAIAFGLMSSSSRTFSRSSADVDVQSEAQLTANAIKELIIDCQKSTDFFDTAKDATDVFTDPTDSSIYKNALLINNDDIQYLIYPNADATDPDEQKQLLYLVRRRTDGGDPEKFEPLLPTIHRKCLLNMYPIFMWIQADTMRRISLILPLIMI